MQRSPQSSLESFHQPQRNPKLFSCHPPTLPVYFPHQGGGLVTKLCQTLATPWTVALQAPLSMGFSRQEYWSGFPFPSPGDIPDPGIKPGSSALRATRELPSMSRDSWLDSFIQRNVVNFTPSMVTFYLTGRPNLFIHSSTDGHLGLRRLWIFMLRLWCGHTFPILLGMYLKREVLGHKVTYMLINLLSHCQIVLQSSYTTSLSTSSVQGPIPSVSTSSTPVVIHP